MSTSQQPFVLTTPMAIVVAGGLIAFALYIGNAKTQDQAAPAANTQPPAAQQPPAQVAGEVSIGDIREVGDNDHVLGASDPKITIIEYSDFECAFCKRFHPTMHRVVEEYPNDVQWVYRHFVLGRFPNSRAISMAAECAGEQGRFWEMSDAIFGKETAVTPADLPTIAEEAGVSNIGEFETCLSEERYASKIDEDTADARVAGGRGTPYSVMIGPDGEKSPINGAQPYESVKQMIDAAL